MTRQNFPNAEGIKWSSRGEKVYIEAKIIHNHNTVKNLSLDHMPTSQLKHLYEHHVVPNDLFFGHTEYQKYIGEKN